MAVPVTCMAQASTRCCRPAIKPRGPAHVRLCRSEFGALASNPMQCMRCRSTMRAGGWSTLKPVRSPSSPKLGSTSSAPASAAASTTCQAPVMFCISISVHLPRTCMHCHVILLVDSGSNGHVWTGSLPGPTLQAEGPSRQGLAAADAAGRPQGTGDAVQLQAAASSKAGAALQCSPWDAVVGGMPIDLLRLAPARCHTAAGPGLGCGWCC